MILLIGGCGYIGSALYPTLTDAHVIDTQVRGNPAKILAGCYDYGKLTRTHIAQYDDIILLAAHSSVPAALADPSGAFHNNVVAFHHLLDAMTNDQRLIYASSSSLYSGAASVSEDHPACTNIYDLSKYIDDALASLSGKRTYGLRFGTVCGPSPNLREDLMINRMVLTAQRSGEVRIQNPSIRRPILGITDLTCAIHAILDGDGEPGTYNLASFNTTVAALGAIVAEEMGVPLITGDDTPAYDFIIDTTKFQETYSFTFHETPQSIVRDLVGTNGSNC